jgi:UDP-N-acetylmuramoyl-L-alanyl-D-glutamate--2,6-diaminopimelate ligase
MFRKLVKALIPRKLFRVIEPYGHWVEALIFDALNGYPARNMKVIGITGTNGKTTTCFMVHRMLYEAGYSVGMMTTVAYGAGNDIKPQIHHMTTVSAPVLFRRIRELRAQGVEWLVLETTSHALAQRRTAGVPYSLAVMTNVTHEHLAYHGTFERYRDAKRRLFKLANKNLRGMRVGVINADDPSAALFASDIVKPITYGIRAGELMPRDLELRQDGSTFTAEGWGDSYHITCGLPGTFNVSNALAAICVGRAIGLSRQQIEIGIAKLDHVEGRMARIDEGQDFTVIVDYAHSPDSFEKLFKDLRPVVKRNLIVVFGSQGTTGDVGKRAIQGQLAGTYADEVVITEEDDRAEDGAAILEAIAGGAEAAGKVRDRDLFLIHDRAAAIQFAIDRGGAGDTVLLLGKGHEKTIERSDGEHPWDESGTAHKALQDRKARLTT